MRARSVPPPPPTPPPHTHTHTHTQHTHLHGHAVVDLRGKDALPRAADADGRQVGCDGADGGEGHVKPALLLDLHACMHGVGCACVCACPAEGAMHACARVCRMQVMHPPLARARAHAHQATLAHPDPPPRAHLLARNLRQVEVWLIHNPSAQPVREAEHEPACRPLANHALPHTQPQHTFYPHPHPRPPARPRSPPSPSLVSKAHAERRRRRARGHRLGHRRRVDWRPGAHGGKRRGGGAGRWRWAS